MKAIVSGWNIMRIIRLTLGTAILVQGIVTKDPATIILGVIIGGMAVGNLGCCGANGCAIDTTDIKNHKTNRL